MASVFKKTSYRPLPDGASVRKRGNAYFAQWTSGGKAYRQPVRKDADGTARLVYESTTYYFRIVCAVTGRRVLINSGCQGKAMAERVMAEHIDEQERIRAGVIKPDQMKAAGKARQTITDVLELYCAFQRAKRKSEKHIIETKNTIIMVKDYCGWQSIGDMNRAGAESYLESRLADGLSCRTHNKNRTALHAFGSWCVHKKHLVVNPFSKIERMDEEDDRRYRRRELTADEVRSIIEAARQRPFDEAAKMNRTGAITTDAEYQAAYWRGWNRAMAYRLMAATGLRWNECRTLSFGDVHLDAEPPHIELKARNAKARKNACIPLCADILPELTSFITERKMMLTGEHSASIVSFPGTFDDKPMFDLPLSIAKVFQADCAAAKVLTEDGTGRRVDAHSLRHFYGTELARAGVPAYRLKALMRHSTIELTDKYYLHVRTHELQSDVNLLPSTMRNEQDAAAAEHAGNDADSFRTHSAQNPCADVPKPALSCNSGIKGGTEKNTAFTGVSANKHGISGQKKMVPRGGIEPPTRGFSVRCSTN